MSERSLSVHNEPVGIRLRGSATTVRWLWILCVGAFLLIGTIAGMLILRVVFTQQLKAAMTRWEKAPELNPLLSLGADPNTRAANGMTLLHIHAVRTDGYSFRRALEAGCDPMVLDNSGCRPADYLLLQARAHWPSPRGLMRREVLRQMMSALERREALAPTIARGSFAFAVDQENLPLAELVASCGVRPTAEDISYAERSPSGGREVVAFLRSIHSAPMNQVAPAR